MTGPASGKAEFLELDDLVVLMRRLGAGPVLDVVFLDVNGWDVMLDDESAFRLVMDVAEGTLDVEAMAGILEAALSPTPTPEP